MLIGEIDPAVVPPGYRKRLVSLFTRDGFDCLHCSSVFPPAYDGQGLTLDHIVPKSMGGTNDPKNLVTSCLRCNTARQDKILPKKAISRLQKQARKPLNRELGVVYVKVLRSVRGMGQVHPLTLRYVESPKKSLQASLGFDI